jgi:small ligand-binding sensory domain FIST
MSNAIVCANALSTHPSLEMAIAELVEQLEGKFSGTPDLGIIFISAAYSSEFSRLMPLLKSKLSLPALIGCGGGGIIGTNAEGQAIEIEGEPAISLTLMQLPGVKVHTFHLPAEDLPDMDSSPDTWVNLVGVAPADNPQFILLADPFSARINDLLAGLDFAYPGAAKIGGLASGGEVGFKSGLFQDYIFHREGTVGVALSGDLVVETIVAQGCRPIGELFQVTRGERNIILEMATANGDKQSLIPLEALRELLDNLNENDRELAQHSLFVGVARNGFKIELETGDFLIRNMLGVDPRLGAVAIGDRVRPGQRLQFHLRDAYTSAEDLEILLQKYHTNSPKTPAGALLFSCLGRGKNLYGKSNFDSQLFQSYMGRIPLAGFFCGGEIGPVGGETFLHGYTSAFGIISNP